jgi:hypothetical protein
MIEYFLIWLLGPNLFDIFCGIFAISLAMGGFAAVVIGIFYLAEKRFPWSQE